jgi:hypothetical protein
LEKAESCPETIMRSYLRRYVYKGINPEKGAVILDNQSNLSVGSTVSADAVRFGGGMGNVSRFNNISGLGRWEEGTKYYAQFGGAPKLIFHYDDAGTDLSQDIAANYWWSDSLHQNGEDCALVRFHTNAGGGTGTVTFANSEHPESVSLQNKVHDEMINDIQKDYDPSWVNRGKKANAYVTFYPNITVELGFHDLAFPDNHYLQDPKFRQLASRAIYQGIVKFFADKNGIPVQLLPEPPQCFSVRNTPSGVHLSWAPPETDTNGILGDPATGYVVYLSHDANAWDNGRETTSTLYTFTDMTPDEMYFFRVSAFNEGGESFPTKTLSSRINSIGHSNILIVDGYDRLDQDCQVKRVLPSLAGTVNTMDLRRMNGYNNIIRHALAMAYCNLYFDSADKSAVENNLINIGDYVVVDWIFGRQGERVTDDNAVDVTFNSNLRSKITNFLLQSKKLFISGTDIGFDLDSNSDQFDPESVFFNTYLKADYVSDDLSDYVIKGNPGSIFYQIPNFDLDDGNYGMYDADAPDILSLSGGSYPAMIDLSKTKIMGVQYESNFRLVYLSFPFETITDESIRNQVMSSIMNFLTPIQSQNYWLLY